MPEENSIAILYISTCDIRAYAPGLNGTTGETDHSFPGVSGTTLRHRHILGNWLATSLFRGMGLSGGAARPQTLEFGKPYIPSLPAFNISHTEGIVACATASYGEIGIDIESIRLLDWQQYRDCFSEYEWSRIAMASEPCERLLEFWTQKESLLKADGRGLQVPMTSVILRGDYGVIENESKKWYLTPVPIAGCFCHVSTEYPVRHMTIQKADDFAVA